jgi:hypothetical protein
MSEYLQHTCLNCNTPLTGKFCSTCGQKEIEPNERTFKYFLFQFFGAAFFLENNFLKNLWALIARPGTLSHDYITGKRKRWMAPFSIFLLINLLYFIINPLSDLSLSLQDQIRFQLHSSVSKPMVERRLEERKLSLNEYAKQYKHQSDTLAKTLVIINVPLSAMFFMVWFYRKKMFFADHFVFFIHFYAWLLFVVLLISMLFSGLIYFNILTGDDNSFAIWAFLTMIGLYLFLSIKKVYEPSSILFLIGSVLFSFVALFATHIAYRFILFVATFYTT